MVVEKKYESSVYKDLLSGAIAGAVAKTTVAPLDRTKIYFQISKRRFSYRNAYQILHESYTRFGIMNWWRGNSATMARVMPYAAIQFASYERIKIYLSKTDQKFFPKLKRLFPGSAAGAIACCCTYPLDMVRARMAVAGKRKYKNLRKALVLIYRDEGLLCFYNGFVPTILGIIPYAGTSFFVYETLKENFYENNPGESLPIKLRLLFGGLAGACGQTASYPLDIIRRRQQTDGLDGKGYKYRSFLGTVKYVLKTEGLVRGLYKGLSMNFIKGPITVGVSFTTYDTVRGILETRFA